MFSDEEERFQAHRFRETIGMMIACRYRLVSLAILSVVHRYLMLGAESIAFHVLCVFLTTAVLHWLPRFSEMDAETQYRSRHMLHVGYAILPLVEWGNLVASGATLYSMALKAYLPPVFMPMIVGTVIRMPAKMVLLWSLPQTIAMCVMWADARKDVGDIEEVNGTAITSAQIWAILMMMVWYLEETERSLYRTQHTATTTFLGSVSHELRTPISAIITFTEELLSSKWADGASAQVRDMLNEVRHASEMLKVEVESLLLMSTLSAKPASGVALSIGPVDVEEVVKRAIALCERRVKKGVIISFQTSATVPRVVHSDAVRLLQVLTNLVGNAAKFTTRGSVTVITETVRLDKEHHRCVLRFTVKDTGIGISEENLKKLRTFAFFNKLSTEESTKLNVGGTGLGITLSKHLAKVRTLLGIDFSPICFFLSPRSKNLFVCISSLPPGDDDDGNDDNGNDNDETLTREDPRWRLPHHLTRGIRVDIRVHDRSCIWRPCSDSGIGTSIIGIDEHAAAAAAAAAAATSPYIGSGAKPKSEPELSRAEPLHPCAAYRLHWQWQ